MDTQASQLKEEWKPVVGFEGLYEVSDMGRVRSLDREIVDNSSGWHKQRSRKFQGKLLIPRNHTGGYVQYILGHSKYVYAHRLVAVMFISNPKMYQEINHKDGNKKNNIVSNLEWVSRQGNADHAWKNGLIKSTPHKTRLVKLTPEIVTEIKKIHSIGLLNYTDIARKYKVSINAISRAIRGLTWKNI